MCRGQCEPSGRAQPEAAVTSGRAWRREGAEGAGRGDRRSGRSSPPALAPILQPHLPAPPQPLPTAPTPLSPYRGLPRPRRPRCHPTAPHLSSQYCGGLGQGPVSALTSLSCLSAASRNAGSMVPRRASMIVLGSMVAAAGGRGDGGQGPGPHGAVRTWTSRLAAAAGAKGRESAKGPDRAAPRGRQGAAPLPPRPAPRRATGPVVRRLCAPAEPRPAAAP